MSDGDRELEQRLLRYRPASHDANAWQVIERRVQRRTRRTHLAAVAAVLLMAIAALLHLATVQTDRALASVARPSMIDVATLADTLGGTPEAVAYARFLAEAIAAEAATPVVPEAPLP